MIYWGTAASFLFFIATAYIAQKFFNFQGEAWYLFITLMGCLGLTSSALYYYLYGKFTARKEAKEAAAASGGVVAGPGGGDAVVDHYVREADKRLAQSGAGRSLAGLPAVFVIGDRGSAKTSTVMHSGLDPELLSGQVYQENQVASTRGANLWFARDTVLVEAGGELMANPGAWKHLVKKLQPGKLQSLVGRGGQSPRAVLLCFDLESFARPGATEALKAAARYLKDRLGEISELLGISFPVYVLFTRGDRLPFFADYVRNLNNEEASQVFGVTVPIRPPAAQGIYAEEETRRLSDAFSDLFYSLCDKRLLLLPRETDPEKLPGAYEFPREFRKLRTAIVEFLVEMCRPSQLRASPFLRGFYFSGVRPVFVQDAPMALAAEQAPKQSLEERGGATRMFRVGKQAEMRAQQAIAQQATGARKVPQWVFLGHLFSDVLLADDIARGASGSSVKTSRLKRVLYMVGSFLLFLLMIAFTISFFGNRGLENTALAAARNIPAAVPNADPVAAGLPPEDSLRRLETLRQSLEELTRYHEEGAPWRLRWGLYSGEAMYPHVRAIYYKKFQQLLFGSTQGAMLTYLQNRPQQAGTEDYGYPFDTLKSYLLTACEWERTKKDRGNYADFLGATLHTRWAEKKGEEIGKERLELARLQFNFYAHDLKNGNPYSTECEAGGVDRSRRYLASFSGHQRVYRGLLSEAARKGPSTTFNQKFAGTSDVVTSNVPVAYAFTKDGFKFMMDEIKKQNFGGEKWVLGDYQVQMPDRATLEKGILESYTKDYIEQWRRVIRGSSVNSYRDWNDASGKLGILTSQGAPLLALFWWASNSTGISLPGVADAFKAVHMVVPPSDQQQYVVQTNQTYHSTLTNFQVTVAARSRNEADDRRVREEAEKARVTTQTGFLFPRDLDARMDEQAMRLLLEPIRNIDNIGIGDLNSGGASFCRAFNALTRKFPFDPKAVPELTLDELGNVLRPKTGMLWQFYETQLKNVMECAPGADCKPKGAIPLSDRFVSSFNQLVRFSRALYGEAGNDPNYKYSLEFQRSDQVQLYIMTVNGEQRRLEGGVKWPLFWPGTGNRNFSLTLRLTGGTEFGIPPRDGLWSVFRFFADADRSTPVGGGYRFLWVYRAGQGGAAPIVAGRALQYEVTVETFGAPAVFSKEFLSTLRCESRVTR